MKKLMHILFLSCLKATELIEKNFYFKLSMREKMQLKMHKMMCNACTIYEKQSVLLDHAIFRIEKPEKMVPDLSGFKKDMMTKLIGGS
jgi:hypothetical protein